MSAKRNLQLDGLRAPAVLGVIWLHWAIPQWRGGIPFEIGLYFFLTLTGFLITRVLLRERDRGEGSGAGWQWSSLRSFQYRRALRILIPCFAAMIFGLVVGAEDLRAHPLVYFAQLSNFHIARLPEWPHGTSHYWTLAIQQQFYLVWPILVLFLPKRFFTLAFLAVIALAPLTRFVLQAHFPAIHHPGAITLCALDYLGCGALLAWAMDQGLKAGDRRLQLAAWGCLPVYAVLYMLDWIGRPLPVLCHFQQTLLSVSMAGLISAALAGLPGKIGHLLTQPWVLHISRISYSLYLLHCLVPIAIGWTLPFLWEIEGTFGTVSRLVAFALATWGVSWLSWRWIEQPVERIRSQQIR